MEKIIPVVDKIESKISGYIGYSEIDQRRSCDATFRGELSSMFDQIEEQLHIKINSTISIKDHVLMNDLDSCMQEIRSLKSKIETKPYKDTESLSKKQLKGNDLDKIYSIDLELINNIDALSLNVGESRSEIIHDLISDIDQAINRRSAFLNHF